MPLILATLGMAACQPLAGEGPAVPGDDDDTQDEVDDVGAVDSGTVTPPPPPAVDSGAAANPPARQPDDDDPPPACAQASQDAKEVLTTYCSNCHSQSPGNGGFSTVLNVPGMIAANEVIPGDPAGSNLFKRLSGGTMPPPSVPRKPSADDIQAVEDWIKCDAPDFNSGGPDVARFEFVSIDSRLEAVLDDLRSMPNPADREDARYLDLTNLSNAGFSKEQIDVYRQSMIFLVNSLSRGRSVVAPEPVDDEELIYRLSLEDYVWNADTWRLFEEIYPYAVVYDPDSRLFPFDEDTAEQIREETGTDIPIIQADWFISHGSRPPLYHDVLELPETLPELEAQLGIDIDQNIADEQVLRAGFSNAGPSKNHRIIERHELDGNVGAFWVSYDFADNLAERNIFANPLDFQEDGGEIIFNLDNGLQAYYVTDAAGNRLDKAPTNVVQDPLARDGAVENGLSCMTCHQEEGMLPKFDEIREFVLTTGADRNETELVLGLYAEQSVLEEAFEDDQNRYRSARADLGISKVSAITFHELNDVHLDLMSIETVAGVLGISVEEFEQAIDASPQVFPGEIVSLRVEGGGIQRDAFEDVVDDTIEALALGEQLLVSNNNVSNNNVSRR